MIVGKSRLSFAVVCFSTNLFLMRLMLEISSKRLNKNTCEWFDISAIRAKQIIFVDGNSTRYGLFLFYLLAFRLRITLVHARLSSFQYRMSECKYGLKIPILMS